MEYLVVKKTILSIFILQLTVLTVVGTALFFRNRYLSLFYTDISYIDVSVSDDEAFDAFLSWIKERDISAARISVSSDNDITLHLSDMTFHNIISLLNGQLPKQGEFVSDIISDDPDQSGIMRRLLPNYNFKIYGLYEPGQLNYFSLYTISLTSESEINEMKNALAPKGVTIQLNEIGFGNSFLALVSSFSSIHIMLTLIFICSSMMIMLVSLIQYVILRFKSVNISEQLGYGRMQIIRSFLGDLFNKKIWLGIMGLVYILLTVCLLLSDIYRHFYIQIVVIFFIFMILLMCVYSLLLSCVIIIYLLIKRNRTSSVRECTC